MAAIGYSRDMNNQIKLRIPWENIYGELQPGIYRIVKPSYDSDVGEIKFYSNAFEIK